MSSESRRFVLSDFRQRVEFEVLFHDWLFSFGDLRFDKRDQILRVVLQDYIQRTDGRQHGLPHSYYLEIVREVEVVFEHVDSFSLADPNGVASNVFSELFLNGNTVTLGGPTKAAVTVVLCGDPIVYMGQIVNK